MIVYNDICHKSLLNPPRASFEQLDVNVILGFVFQSLCKCAEFKERLRNHLITDIEWRVLKSSMHFLSDAQDCTKMASASSYATISMQPLIFKRLLKLCDATISGTVTTGFTTPVVQKAAAALKSKLLTYEAYMCSENNMIALVLDPRSGNFPVDAHILKNRIRDILRSRYQYATTTNQNDTLISNINVDLFEEETDAATIEEDEVDIIYQVTSKRDGTCKDVLEWWKSHAARFPYLSKLARDTFMIMGSSVPSESSFSDSGQMIRANRSHLSDESICTMMKLRSWNRLMGKFD
jgi:hypothetical protein